ncbi:hypothetical protein GAGA_2762 [Paraglaciecola agarilytica NO2]|uniref:Uncharacterized protein n=1 Tax=Paraglaciecola agarilytica NO2 TaxID=1125747 RepID=A0ABQ0I8E3_9ALTE|nr:hypothetical protein GAGA_2762 [Paraglaciecola agarilytica NO2]
MSKKRLGAFFVPVILQFTYSLFSQAYFADNLYLLTRTQKTIFQKGIT